jgi:prevent-host-death family protein
MTTLVSIAEVETQFAVLVSRAEAGEDLVITRNGRPVARLSALERKPVSFGDLAGLRADEDLSLPNFVINGFATPRE